jgi:hypothetical protein
MRVVWAKAGVSDGNAALAKLLKQMLAGAPPGIIAEYEELMRVQRGGFAELRAAGEPPEVPTSILLAGLNQKLPDGITFPGDADKYFQALLDQRIDHFTRLVRRLPKGHLLLTSESSHFIQNTEPELIVSETLNVLAAASRRPR